MFCENWSDCTNVQADFSLHWAHMSPSGTVWMKLHALFSVKSNKKSLIFIWCLWWLCPKSAKAFNVNETEYWFSAINRLIGFADLCILCVILPNMPASVAQLDAPSDWRQEVAGSTLPRSATFFSGDWSWNIFYGHSLPSADSRKAVVSFWRKKVHNTG